MTSSRLAQPSMMGTIYCALSAVFYAGFYTCQGSAAENLKALFGGIPAAFWITCLQAAIAALLIGGYMVWQTANGRRFFPSWKETLKLAGLGLLGQFGGVLMVWAMALVGVGISMVVGTSIMLASTAILGLIFLNERVSWQQIVAIVLMTASVICFSMGGEAAKPEESATADTTKKDSGSKANVLTAPADSKTITGRATVYLGIVVAGLSGFSCALLTVGIRKMVTGSTSAEAMVFFLNVMGPVALIPLCLYQIGFDSLMHTPAGDLGIIILAGPLNLAGLLLVTKSLQLINAVRVNVINNGLCTTLGVIAGIFLLGEPHNYVIITGVIMSIAGILLISLADPNQSEAAVVAQPSVTVAVE